MSSLYVTPASALWLQALTGPRFRTGLDRLAAQAKAAQPTPAESPNA